MSWPLFTKLMDEAGPHIKELYFYNYGEPFVHPKALDMLAYARALNPTVQITTSTNGIMLAREGMAERIVEENLLDFICFTIGGIDQESYARYHKSGSFEKAMLGMRRLAEEKRRTGKTTPVIHWRYLLFNWNDSDAQIAEALRLRDEIGVDEFKFMLSWTPMDGRSFQRAPGTPGFEAIRLHVAYQDGYCPEPFAEAGLWQPEDSPLLGHFCWTGKTARILMTPTNGRGVLRFARPAMLDVPQPKVTLRMPWGTADAQVGMKEWIDTPIAVPDQFADAPVPIEIDVDPIFRPMRQIESTDSRDLGVMMSMDGVAPQPNPYRAAAVGLTVAADQTR